MKKLLFIIAVSLFTVSCTKEFSADLPKKDSTSHVVIKLPERSNEILVTITGVPYVTTVNGSTGNYWKITVTISHSIAKSIDVIYSFDDDKSRGETISQGIIAGQMVGGPFFTTIPAVGQMTNIKLLLVNGANEYKFIY